MCLNIGYQVGGTGGRCIGRRGVVNAHGGGAIRECNHAINAGSCAISDNGVVNRGYISSRRIEAPITKRNIHYLLCVSTDLIGGCAITGRTGCAVKNIVTVPLRIFGYAGNFIFELLEFKVEAALVSGCHCAISRLHCEFTHALHHITQFNRCTVSGLNHADRIASVLHRLIKTFNLRGHARGNGNTGRIVLGRVNALASR